MNKLSCDKNLTIQLTLKFYFSLIINENLLVVLSYAVERKEISSSISFLFFPSISLTLFSFLFFFPLFQFFLLSFFLFFLFFTECENDYNKMAKKLYNMDCFSIKRHYL